MYNFGILSFESFNIKFRVILNLQISRKCPLLISNLNFKIQGEFQKVCIEKVVEL
jgi:hypothetical protein